MTWYGLNVEAAQAIQLMLVLTVFFAAYLFLNPDRKGLQLRERYRVFQSQDPLIRFATFASFGAIAAVLFIYGFPHCGEDGDDCRSKLSYLLTGSPNEVGDALAGVVGALAFLWLITTVLLQGKELRGQRQELAAQRQELQLAREETAKMATSMDEQANHLAQQSSFLLAEFDDRRFERARKLLNVQLKALSDLIDLEARRGNLFAPIAGADEHLYSTRDGEEYDVHIFSNRDAVGEFYFRNETMNLGTQALLGASIQPYMEVHRLCQEILKASEHLPEDQVARLEYMRFDEFADGIHSFIESDVWADQAHDPSNPSNFLSGPTS